MALLAACATGNFTTAGTWALVDSTSLSNSETTSVILTTSYVTSSTFTPGAITIDGFALKISGRSASPTGAVTVALDQGGSDVAGTIVTVNVSDIPLPVVSAADVGWFFFKFSAPVTLLGATAYSVKAKTSSSTQVTPFVTSGTNWSRFLRTTTTQAPVAGDDLIITGEWTAAATVAARTVTMNETAATDYGAAPTAATGLIQPGIAISTNGTLTFGTTAATNYLLQLSNSLIVYNGGTLNIGTTGTPVPRDGTAILQFDCAADGDYGLIARNGSTVNLQGLSRTSGKNIVSCKLNADPSPVPLYTVGIGSFVALNQLTQTSLAGVEGSGLSRLATGVVDTVSNAVHVVNTGNTGTVSNTTQVFSVWIARGSGTNNRFVRIQLGNIGTLSPPSNGFYADVDLQAGTIGACTANGTGTATSSSITAVGGGFVCSIVGKAASGSGSSIGSVVACNAAGVTTYAGDATQNFLAYGATVYTNGSVATDLTVDTDTGWLAGDVVAIASTTRTASDSELQILASNAGASTLTLKQYPAVNHSGTSPTQAEVILLTRNVKVRSTSSTLMTYVRANAGSVVDIDWAEFFWIGVNAVGQRGIEVEVNSTAATNFSMQFSSIHDGEILGLMVLVNSAAGTLTNLVFSSNTLWNMSTTSGPSCQISGAITSTNWTFDSNILIRNGNSNGWTLSDIGGTFTNNTVVSAASNGFAFGESSTAFGTISGNITHSNTSLGYTLTSAGMSGTISTPTAWRNSASGFSISAAVVDLVIDTLVGFGNTTNNASLTASCSVRFKAPVLNGDTTFSTTNGFSFSVQGLQNIIVDNGDLSTVSGIKTAHTSDINLGIIPIDLRAILRNTKLGAATEIAGITNLAKTGFISSEKHDQTAGNHKTWSLYGATTGALVTDATTFNTAAPSMLMTPTSASFKLESATQFQGMKVAVASGNTVNIAVYIRKSVAYNGNQPRLIQKANPALGQDNDVVIATYSAGTGSWNQISGTSSVATDDGVWEFVVDCDGTAGAINVDDWSQTGGISLTGALQGWFNGLPADYVTTASSGGFPVLGGPFT